MKDQPSSGPPPKGWRFNPIYVEPRSPSINSTRDIQALFPKSFDCIDDMLGEYNIKKDPIVLPVQHGRWIFPIEYKEEIEKELGEMVCQGIITKQTEPTPWVSSLTYPKNANGKLRICLNLKDLPSSVRITRHHPRGDSPCVAWQTYGDLLVILGSPRVTYYTSYTFDFIVNISSMYHLKT